MSVADFLYATILGIVQGISEFLPISSSAHLIIVSWLHSDKPLPITLNIALHVGTLLAVLIYFWRDWLKIVVNSKNLALRKEKSFETSILIPALIVGSIPAGIIGVLWQDEIEAFFHNPLSTVVPLIVVGILLWWFDKSNDDSRSLERLTLKDAILIGIAQATALIPGTSRSGATILAARLLCFNKQDAARFSFLLGTPAMLGAAVLNSGEILESITEPTFYFGCGVATLSGCLAIKFLLSFLKKFGFAAFAVYRVILGLVIYWIV